MKKSQFADCLMTVSTTLMQYIIHDYDGWIAKQHALHNAY